MNAASGARSAGLRAALFFALASVAMTWPLAIAPGALYSSRQDLYLGLWNLEWVAAWVRHPGSALFHTTQLFFPLGTGLEVQPLSLFQALLAAPLTLTFGPLVAFNLLALVSFWFAGWMTFLYARALLADERAAWVAGAVFAFAPFHFTYLPELNLLPVGVIPLYLWCALRLERGPSHARALLCGAALAVVGLCDWYYGLATGLVALVLGVRRLRARERSLAREALHWGACLALLAPVVVPMAAGFRGKDFVQLAEREGMAFVMEAFKGTRTTVGLWAYAGVVALLLAAAGTLAGRRARALLVLALVSFVLSLGRSLGDVPLPFALFEHVPFLADARYPDRFFVLTQLALALLAGLGASELARRLGAGAWLGGACVLLVLVEFAPFGLPSVPPPPPSLVPRAASGASGAVVHVPTRLRSRDGEQMWLQLGHGRPIAGGYLTRRDEGLVRRLAAVPGLGALLGSTPGALPDGLRAELGALGIAYVCVQKRPLVAGFSLEEQRLLASFRLGGPAYLRQRLFPSYQDPREGAAQAQAWIQELTRVLGAPEVESAEEALFHVRS